MNLMITPLIASIEGYITGNFIGNLKRVVHVEYFHIRIATRGLEDRIDK